MPIRPEKTNNPQNSSVRQGEPSLPALPETYPDLIRYPVVLDGLRTLTDDTGLIQHGVGGIPDCATGYTTDDNARAFLAMVRLWRALPERRVEIEPLLRRYLGFMAWTQRRSGPFAGWFVNFVSYDRKFLDEKGTDDCLGRCLWALGEAMAGPLPTGCALAVRTLYNRALKPLSEVRDAPRAIAYALLGLTRGSYRDRELLRSYTDPLLEGYQRYASPDWPWLEPYLTYDNARLVEALWRAGAALEDGSCRRIARAMLDFLTEHSIGPDGLEPIGNRGWWQQGQPRPLYDQQTLEAGAYTELYWLVEDRERARLALEWFYGHNTQGLPIYDPDTGGCYDSLTPEGANLNQGAESVLSYLLAVSAILGNSEPEP